MTKQLVELKPCPFCADPMIHSQIGIVHMDVSDLNDCPLAGISFEEPEAWNTRAPTPAPEQIAENANCPDAVDIGELVRSCLQDIGDAEPFVVERQDEFLGPGLGTATGSCTQLSAWLMTHKDHPVVQAFLEQACQRSTDAMCGHDELQDAADGTQKVADILTQAATAIQSLTARNGEAVAQEREACAKVADAWATPEQIKFGEGGAGAEIRNRGGGNG